MVCKTYSVKESEKKKNYMKQKHLRGGKERKRGWETHLFSPLKHSHKTLKPDLVLGLDPEKTRRAFVAVWNEGPNGV